MSQHKVSIALFCYKPTSRLGLLSAVLLRKPAGLRQFDGEKCVVDNWTVLHRVWCLFWLVDALERRVEESFMPGLAIILAYIDPNSGGLLFQLLAAAFVLLSGTFFFFSSQIKMGIARLRRYFKEKPDEDRSSEPENRPE